MVLPLPLPGGASFNAMTGEFRFSPGAGDVGSHRLSFSASDGSGQAQETITISVDAPPPGGVTALRGRLIDTNQFVDTGIEVPISGATVSLLRTGFSTTSDSNGYFTLSGIPDGTVVLDIDSSTASGPIGYAGFREAITVIGQIDNVVERPFYLPQLAAGTRIDNDSPSGRTVVENVELGVRLEVENGTAMMNGGLFEGEISISEVPMNLAPAALPECVDPDLLITIQPVGVIFTQPAPITFPNRLGLSSGMRIDLWSLDPETGQFVVVGVGEVSQDGRNINTIEGGIVAADWHYLLPPISEVLSEIGDAYSGLVDGICGVFSGSRTQLGCGNLRVSHTMPAYRSLNTERALTLVYNSTLADPQPVVAVDTSVGGNVLIPARLSTRASVGGVELGPPVDSDLRSLRGGRELIRSSYIFDASEVPTGLYPYELTLASTFTQGEATSSFKTFSESDVLVRNERGSVFGAGWSLAGLSRIHLAANGDAIVAEGDGSTTVFNGSGIYENKAQPGPEWSLVAGETEEIGLGVTPVGSRPFIGPFHADRLQLNVGEVPEHTGVRVSLELFLIGGWQGTGPSDPEEWDLWGMGPAGGDMFVTSFNTVTAGEQAYPGRHPFSRNFRGSGSSSYGKLGYSWSSVYRVEREFDHTDRSLILEFFGTDETRPFQPTEWGISEIHVSLVGAADAMEKDYLAPEGEFTSLRRNADGTFTREFKDGTTVEFTAEGFQTSVRDRNGNATRFEYDGDERLRRIIDPVGRVTVLDYAGGFLSKVTDPAGRETLLEQRGGNLTKITDNDGTSRQFTYDDRHLLRTQIAKRLLTTTYDYGVASRHVRSELADGTERSFAPAETFGLTEQIEAALSGVGSGLVPLVRSLDVTSSLTDGNENTHSVSTDEFGHATRIVDGSQRVTGTLRDRNGQPVQVTKPGYETQRTYDARGNLTRLLEGVQTPWQRETLIDYEQPFSLVKRITVAEDRVTEFEYEQESGNLMSVTDEEGETRSFTYYDNGLVKTATDENGHTTAFSYDDRWNLQTVTDAEGQVTRYERNSTGDVEVLVEAAGTDRERRTRYRYDSLGRIREVENALGGVTRFARDDDGNVETTTLPTGETATTKYDAYGRIREIDDPRSGKTVIVRDGNGNVETLTDARGRTTTYTYDGANRLTGVDLPLEGISETYGYDNRGNLDSIRRGAQSVGYNYDALDRVRRRTRSDAATVEYTYDVADNLTSRRITGPGDHTINYEYDKRSQLKKIVLPGGAELTYDYDRAGNLVLANDSDSEVTFTYDRANRRKTEGISAGGVQPEVTLTSTYDGIGNRSVLSASGGASWAYGYDVLSRLESLTTPATSTIELPDYDLSGRLRSIEYPNGTSSEFDFDDRGRLEEVAHFRGLQALAGTEYGYNDVGYIDSVSDRSGTTELQYDDLDRLTSGVLGDSYEYDELGNRLGTGEQYNRANELQSDDGHEYEHDDYGRLVLKRRKIDGAETLYRYDKLDQLTAIEQPSGETFTYQYDALGRRIGKVVEGVSTTYVYDGDAIVLEYEDGVEVARYSHGLGIDEPLAMERGGEELFFHRNHQGSTMLLTGSGGGIQAEYEYDSYGRPTALPQANLGNPFTYTGREYDPESGLYYYRARYYDAERGRFLTEDPIGFAAGELNLYRYVENNPANLTDPSGAVAFLAPLLVAGGEYVLLNVAVGSVGGLAVFAGCEGLDGNLSPDFSQAGNFALSGALLATFLNPYGIAAVEAALASEAAAGVAGILYLGGRGGVAVSRAVAAAARQVYAGVAASGAAISTSLGQGYLSAGITAGVPVTALYRIPSVGAGFFFPREPIVSTSQAFGVGAYLVSVLGDNVRVPAGPPGPPSVAGNPLSLIHRPFIPAR